RLLRGRGRQHGRQPDVAHGAGGHPLPRGGDRRPGDRHVPADLQPRLGDRVMCTVTFWTAPARSVTLIGLRPLARYAPIPRNGATSRALSNLPVVAPALLRE